VKVRLFAVFIVLLGAAGCGSASDVGSGQVPTTIALLDSVETAAATTVETMLEPTTTTTTTTTTAVERLDSSTTTESIASSTTSEVNSTTITTAPPTTTTTVDPNAEYCASYNALAAMDTSITPGDTEATAAVFAAREAAWIQAAALAPASISTEAAIVRDFVSALRQLLAENGNDLGAVLFEAVELEAETGADVAQVIVEQFGLLVCGTETSVPEEQTAVFYAGLLDTDDRRSVLADLLSTDGVLSVDESNCFVAEATAEMMFPLTGAPSTPDQEASLGQLLGVCQLTAGGA
jgi:hypothetical protein